MGNLLLHQNTTTSMIVGTQNFKQLYNSRLPGEHRCPRCGNCYRYKTNMMNHLKNECGVEPRFRCPYCSHKSKLKGNLMKHIKTLHKDVYHVV